MTLLVTLLACSLLAAYSTVSQEGPKQSIDGVVRRTDSQDPIAGVRIILAEPRQATQPSGQFGLPNPVTSTVQPSETSVTSDSSGRFTLKNVRPGAYILRTERDGFNSVNVQATIRPGQDIKDLLLRLMATGIITGRLTTQGVPASKVRVEALRLSYVAGKNVLQVGGRTESDDHGMYRLYGLSPGRYYLRASIPASSDTFTTYAPASRDVASASLIDLTHGGEISGIDVSLRQGKTVRLTGSVALDPGDEGARLSFYLQSRDGATFPEVGVPAVPNLSSSANEFQLVAVEPGNYDLYTVARIGTTKTLSGRVSLNVPDRDVQSIHIPLNLGVAIKGQIEVKGGDTRQPVNSVRVQLHPIGDHPYSSLRLSAGNDAQGQFEILNVPPGVYAVQVLLQRTVFLADIRSDGKSINNDATLTIGNQDQRLQITIGRNGGRIDGTVSRGVRGGSLSGAAVWLVPVDATRTNEEFTRTVTSELDGRFSILGVAPGDYKLVAIEQGNVDRPVDVRSMYRDQGSSVRIGEGDSLTIDPVLITRP